MEMMSDSASLVLLVGTNPLPNYVIADFLSSKGAVSTIYFVYSESNDKRNQNGTKEYADNIKECLKKNLRQKVNVKFTPLCDVSSFREIERDFDKYFQELKKQKMHLNITGGTKTMAASSYAWFKEKCSSLEISYLDARTHKLIYENNNDNLNGGDLRECVRLNIECLLALHGYKMTEDSLQTQNDCAKYSCALEFIPELIKDDNFICFVKDINKIFRQNKFWSNYKDLLKENFKKCTVAEYLTKYLENEKIKEFLSRFPKDQSLIEDGSWWAPPQNTSENQIKKRVKDSIKYLKGMWLEQYVYEDLKKVLTEKSLRENENFGWSLKAKKDNGAKNFELDIFFLIGYQLTGISVTSSEDENLVKSKAFEVLHRVSQIGGEESMAILVCGLDNCKIQTFEDDIQQTTGSTKEKFKVFGINDWQDIGKKIKDFILDN